MTPAGSGEDALTEDACRISVVIPLFNEEESLIELHRRLVDVLVPMGGGFEIIFVDDGSVDNSFEALREIHRTSNHVRVLRLRRNFGKAVALSAGFREARGEIILTLDADLQDVPEEIPRLLAKLDEGYDFVSGWKVHRQDSRIKTTTSRLFNRVTNFLSGVHLHDINSGFKAYRREVVRDILLYGDLHRFIPVQASWKGFRVCEVEVVHAQRRYGRSKYGPNRFYRGVFDLMTVLFLTRYFRRPLHFFGVLGSIFLVGGLGINIYITYLRLRHGHIMERYPLLFLGVLLMVVGIQLATTDFLGEMITSMHKGGDDLIRERLE